MEKMNTPIRRIESSQEQVILENLRDILERNRAQDDARHPGLLTLGTKEERQMFFRELTQFSFLTTNFLIAHAGDRKKLGQLWASCDAIAQEGQLKKELRSFRKGILTQVAVYHILVALGKHPTLSHPDEDAFHAIDMWMDADEVVQIKAGKGFPAVFDTEHIAFPGAQVVEANGESAHYSSADFLAQKIVRFRAKVKDYSRHIGKKLKGYTLVVPYEYIDHESGMPQEHLVEYFRDKLDGHTV